MAVVDIPMYINRYLYNPMNNTPLGLIEGFYSAASCNIISQDIHFWREEIPWMTAYFSMAVWSSLYLVTNTPTIHFNKNNNKKKLQ